MTKEQLIDLNSDIRDAVNLTSRILKGCPVFTDISDTDSSSYGVWTWNREDGSYFQIHLYKIFEQELAIDFMYQCQSRSRTIQNLNLVSLLDLLDEFLECLR